MRPKTPGGTFSHPFWLPILPLILLAGCGGTGGPEYRIRSEYAVSDPQFARSMGNLLGPAIIPGNSISTLRNGHQIFPAMLTAIRSAKKTINLETYIYWSGKIGQEFSDALAERAAAGVKVHILIDWLGSGKIDQKFMDVMKKSGAEVITYHPVYFYDVNSLLNLDHRTHRKLLIIDGEIGFTGGVGIADEWSGNAESPAHWRDNHYRVTGPIVSQLQAAFLDNWLKTTGEVLDGEAYFPPLPETGPAAAQVFKSSASGGTESMQLMFLMSIAAARHSVRMENAYFVPDDLTLRVIVDACKRGVKVEFIVPGRHIDERIVRHASRARWGDLLKAGVVIVEYEPTMFHCKQMVVDDLWVSVGSSNLDSRSFRINDEANLNVLSAEFAKEQSKIFDEDRGHAHRVTYEEWQRRPLGEKFMEGLASLFGHEL